MNARSQALGAVLAAFATVSMARGASPPAPAAGPDQRALIKLEQDWVDAENRHDAAALRSILDDRFVATFGTHDPLDKEAFIRAETEGAPDPAVRQEFSDRKVIVAGRTAVIIEKLTQSRTRDGKPVALSWRFTATYIKRGDHWRALAEQGGPTSP